MKLPSQRRLNIEDFSSEEQELVQKLALTLNINFESLFNALSNRLTFADNFSSTQKTFLIQVNTAGIPIVPTNFKLTTNNNVIPKAVGTQVIRAANVTNPTVYPTAGIFVSFSQTQDTIIINNITGLPSNNVFEITLVVFH